MTQDCGLIDLLEPGDVDKGVDIQHLATYPQEGNSHLFWEEADTRYIASIQVHIHVERAMADLHDDIMYESCGKTSMACHRECMGIS